ncbi:MAG: extracellular solute-binding protein [Alistipes sp.]|nr:extracellular solute-binding protein [Alistipes sp.]
MKKLVSLLLVLTMVFSLVACGPSANEDPTTAAPSGNTDVTTAAPEETTKASAEKPASITITCDGTVVTEDDNAPAFYAELEALLGIDLEFERPDHSGYKDYIGTLFGAGADSLPDVVLLSADAYATYASLGYLWDMTDAWENSEPRNSGRISQMGLDLFEGSKVVGPDGEFHLYGFSAVQGNGCVTYVKQSWLDAAGITELPKTYEEYYDMLKKMKEAKGTAYVVSAAGLVGGEAPYINYLPEFYQDAYPEFYEKNGVWVDGFGEDAMKGALQRLADAYADGLIDPEIVNRSTSDCRNNFYADEFGVFTYWAGKWCNTLTVQNASKAGYPGAADEVMVPMAPIAEVGTYLNRIAPQWCITTNCKNPEGVFEHYLSKMLDGRDVQLLWEYGTHYTYENGVFTLTALESSGNTASYNHIDGLLKLGEYASDFNGGVDIGLDVASPKIAQDAMELFNANTKMAPSIKKTDAMNEYSATIWTVRKSIIADVAMGKMTVEEGMAKYETECGSMVEEILASLN